MKPYVLISFFLVFCLMISCTEDYHFPNLGEQTTIVISGLMTNEEGPYYVRVVESISDISTLKTRQRPINDARVTIYDDQGSMDELRSFFTIPLDSTLRPLSEDHYEYFIEIPDGHGGQVRFSIEKSYNRIIDDIREGAYFTTSIRGVPGNAYTLKVEYDGREYTATDYMCYGTVIDSISVEPIGRYIDGKPDDSDGFMVPCLYFAEPQDETNFYMFKSSNSTYYYYEFENEWIYESHMVPVKNTVLKNWNMADWEFSVISDRFLPPYVYQYKMSDGDHYRKWYSGTDMGFWPGWGSGNAVDMYCITEPVYRYYAALSRQYYEDGGAFSPSPASPPTNFSGGAQGCFSAASVSQYKIK